MRKPQVDADQRDALPAEVQRTEVPVVLHAVPVTIIVHTICAHDNTHWISCVLVCSMLSTSDTVGVRRRVVLCYTLCYY